MCCIAKDSYFLGVIRRLRLNDLEPTRLAYEVEPHNGSILKSAADCVHAVKRCCVALVLPSASLCSVNKAVELGVVTLESPT